MKRVLPSKKDMLSHFLKYVLCGLMFSSVAMALPDGFQLVSGNASAPELGSDGVTTVYSKDRAIIQWDRFSIDAHENFRFLQSGSDMVVLNRVMGGDESRLLGALSSNGQIYIINPQGVFIGPEGRIDTTSFIASSLDVLDGEFLNSKSHLFLGKTEGSVINMGSIYCASGNVALIGVVVRNDGTIEAPNGKVGLGVGTEVLLQPEATPYIYIRTGIQADVVKREGSSLSHEGSISALTVELKSGSNVYAKAIQSRGLIEALRVEELGGEVYLIADEGICEVSAKILATPQGSVHILGDDVRILKGAVIDVSGNEGGGTILVGGDNQGQNPEVKNARYTVGEKGTVFNANALRNGNGGKVILWADESMSFCGDIYIEGGSCAGDGGFAEVSGHFLNFQGAVQGQAPFGKSGLLLLDPGDVQIDATMALPSYGMNYATNSITHWNHISLGNVLNTPCDVTITTYPSVTGPTFLPGENFGSIVVNAPVTWTSSSTLTLMADSLIAINAPITNTGGGNFVLRAAGDNSSGGVVSYTGVTIHSPISITGGSGNGTITISGVGQSQVDSQSGVEVAANLTAANIIFENCIGAGGLSGSNFGVYIHSGTTLTAKNSIQFENIEGGSVASENYGVYLVGSAELFAPVIHAESVFGGCGVNNNIGFNYAGGTIGNLNTQMISVSASSLGQGSGECGISCSGSFVVGDGGEIVISGVGGGSSSHFGTSNFGVNLVNSRFEVGVTHGLNVNQIYISGIGGSGSGGNQHGVNVSGSFTALLLGTNRDNGITFQNVYGGHGFGANTNYGVNFVPSFFAFNTDAGQIGKMAFNQIIGGDIGVYFGSTFSMGVGQNLSLTNVFGGNSDAGNYGIFIPTDVILSVDSLSATNIQGGAGNDVGFCMSGSKINAVNAVEIKSSGKTGVQISAASTIIAGSTLSLISSQNSHILLGDCSLRGESVAISGTTILTADTVAIIGRNGILFTNDTSGNIIDGGFHFIADAGKGLLTLNGNVGNLMPPTLFTTMGAGFEIGGGITTQGVPIYMENPVTITANLSLSTRGSTGLLSAPITLGVVNGFYNLTLNPGLASLNVTSIGQTTPIGNIVIVNAETTTMGAVSGLSLTQQAGTMTSTFGSITTTGSVGAILTGDSFSIASIATGGSLSINPLTIRSFGLLNGIAISSGMNTSAEGVDGGPIFIDSHQGICIGGLMNSSAVGSANGGNIVLTSHGGPVTLNGTANIDTSAKKGNAGNVTITAHARIGTVGSATRGSVTVLDIDASSSNGKGGSIVLQPDATYTFNAGVHTGVNLPSGLLIFNGTTLNTLGGPGLNFDGFVALSPAGRKQAGMHASNVETIVSENGSVVNIYTGTLLKGPYEVTPVFRGVMLSTGPISNSRLSMPAPLQLSGTTPSPVRYAHSRQNIIYLAVVSTVENEDHLPIFWPDWQYQNLGVICQKTTSFPQPCGPLVNPFNSFIFENRVDTGL